MSKINLALFEKEFHSLDTLETLIGLTSNQVAFIEWVLNKSDSMVYVQDMALSYLWVENPIDGWQTAEMVGHTDYVLNHSADILQHLLINKNKVLSTGIPLRGEHWISAKEDKLIFVRYDYKRIDFQDGSYGLLGVETDLTGLRLPDLASQSLAKLLEYKAEQLSITEERFHAALEGGPVSFFVLDDQLRYVWGYNFLDELQRSPLGKTDFEFGYNRQEADRLTSYKRQALETDKEVVYERWEHQPHSKKLGYYRTSFKPYNYGGARGIIGKVVDLTHEMQMGLKLETALNKLQETSKALEEYSQGQETMLREARAMQLALLPDLTMVPRHCAVSGKMERSAEMGGDYYDFLHALPKEFDPVGKCWLSRGDAAGNGLEAGILMATVKNLLYVVRNPANKPCQTLEAISKRLGESGLQETRVGMHLASFWCTPNREGEYLLIMATAGMPPYYVYRADTGLVETVEAHGPTLSGDLQKADQFDEHDFEMRAGDMLVLLSNGMAEVKDPEGKTIPPAMLADCIAKTCKDGPDAVTAGLTILRMSYSNCEVPDDDATVLALQFNAIDVAIAQTPATKA